MSESHILRTISNMASLLTDDTGTVLPLYLADVNGTMQTSGTETGPGAAGDPYGVAEDAGVASPAEKDCNLFTLVLYVGVFGSLCVFGLVGNTLSFLVLQWEKQNKVATFLLQVMAMIDNLFLFTTGFTQIFSAVTLYTEDTYHPASAYLMVWVWPLVHITQMGTVWITVLIALNRYIAICRPFQAPLWCTMKRVRLQLAVMCGVIIFYNIPRFLEYSVKHDYDTNTNTTINIGVETAMKVDEVYNILYENILYCLFVFLGPLLILIVLNTRLCQELWRARQRLIQRNLPVSGEEEEQNLTLVMVVIIIIFLVCQTPAFLNQLLSLLLGQDAYGCGKPYYYYFHISNLLVSANSSLNFVVYCIFRKQFRARLWAFCGCKRKTDSMACSSHYNSSTGHTVSTYSPKMNGNKAIQL